MWVTGKSICSSDRLARSEGTFHRAPRCQLLLPIHVQAHLRIRHQAGEKRDHGHPLHELPLLDIEVHFQDIVSSPIVYHFQDKTIRTEKASLEFRESPSKCSAAHPKMQYVSLRGAVHQSPRMTSLLFSRQVGVALFDEDITVHFLLDRFDERGNVVLRHVLKSVLRFREWERKRDRNRQRPRPPTLNLYREVQLDFTQEMEVFHMLFERSHSIFSVTSLKHHM